MAAQIDEKPASSLEEIGANVQRIIGEENDFAILVFPRVKHSETTPHMLASVDSPKKLVKVLRAFLKAAERETEKGNEGQNILKNIQAMVDAGVPDEVIDEIVRGRLQKLRAGQGGEGNPFADLPPLDGPAKALVLLVMDAVKSGMEVNDLIAEVMPLLKSKDQNRDEIDKMTKKLIKRVENHYSLMAAKGAKQ